MRCNSVSFRGELVVTMFRRSATHRAGIALLVAAFLPLGAHAQQGFSFSKDQERAAQERAATEAARQQRIASNLSTPCRDAIKNKKIMVIIGEQQSNGYVLAQQQNYGPHFQIINARLRGLGLQTFTPEEIRKQIAQAEIDAYFKNDPDAALSASRRLGASFVMRGLITSQATVNPVLRVNQVSVGMGFTLTSANGKNIADAAAAAASYAGPDVRAMAVTLLNEQADEVVSKLYSDYCRNADVAASAKAKK
jgi:hypothetical protein